MVDKMRSYADNDRNPSPPPEGEEGDTVALNVDAIGSTVFSQKFVLQCLVDILKEQTSDTEGEELDETFEDQLSQLWDMSTNQEVAQFLLDSDCLKILGDGIESTGKPRLCEILLGISANIACIPECWKEVVKNEEFLETVLHSLSYRDIPSLRESYRLLASFDEVECIPEPFWAEFQRLETWGDIYFVLSSCTNVDLLRYVVVFVDNIIDKLINIDKVNHGVFVENILTALDELIKDNQFEAFASAMHLIHSTVQNATVITETVDKCVKFITANVKMLEKWDSYKDVHLSIICSIFAICNTLVGKYERKDLKQSKEFCDCGLEIENILNTQFDDTHPDNQYLSSALTQLAIFNEHVSIA